MTHTLKRFIKDESGATAIEYGLLAALLSVAIVGGASSAGVGLSDLYTEVSDCLEGGTGNATCN